VHQDVPFRFNPPAATQLLATLAAVRAADAAANALHDPLQAFRRRSRRWSSRRVVECLIRPDSFASATGMPPPWSGLGQRAQ
jgi:type II secretory pathway component PulL